VYLNNLHLQLYLLKILEMIITALSALAINKNDGNNNDYYDDDNDVESRTVSYTIQNIKAVFNPLKISHCTKHYTRCYFNVRSKADIS